MDGAVTIKSNVAQQKDINFHLNSVDFWSVIVIILVAVSKACISNKRPHRLLLSGESSAGFGTILQVGVRWLKGLAFDAFTRPQS